MTRRSFFRKLGGIGGILAAEATLNPLEKVTDWLTSTDRIPEGAIDQRIIVMKKITRDLVTASTPEDKEKANNVLWAWLKFNGAQVYAQQQGYEITNDFLKHFLYGEGEKKDISSIYPEVVFKSQREIFSDKNTSRDEVIADYLQNMMNSTTNYYPEPNFYYHKITSVPSKLTTSGESNSDSNKLKFTKVVGPGHSEDLYNSINSHSLSFSGDMSSFEEYTNDQGKSCIRGVCTNVIINVYDKYDWGNTSIQTVRNTRQIIAAFLHSIGLEEPDEVLSNLFTKEQLDYNFAIDDLEGKLLVDTGYGQEFEVEGAFSLQAPVVVEIPKDLIPS